MRKLILLLSIVAVMIIAGCGSGGSDNSSKGKTTYKIADEIKVEAEDASYFSFTDDGKAFKYAEELGVNDYEIKVVANGKTEVFEEDLFSKFTEFTKSGKLMGKKTDREAGTVFLSYYDPLTGDSEEYEIESIDSSDFFVTMINNNDVLQNDEGLVSEVIGSRINRLAIIDVQNDETDTFDFNEEIAELFGDDNSHPLFYYGYPNSDKVYFHINDDTIDDEQKLVMFSFDKNSEEFKKEVEVDGKWDPIVNHRSLLDDGKKVLLAELILGDSEYALYDIETGEIETIIEGDISSVNTTAEDVLVYLDNENNAIKFLDIHTEKETEVHKIEADYEFRISALTVSYDRSKIAYLITNRDTDEKTIRILELK